MSHKKSLSSVDSDNSEWNLILRFVTNIQQNFHEEVANYDPIFFRSIENVIMINNKMTQLPN